MRFLWLIFCLFAETSSFLIITKVKLNFNPMFGVGAVGIETLPSGMTTVNFEGNLTRVLNGKVQLTPQLFIMEGKRKKSVLRMPTVNYCDMMRGQVMMPTQMVQTMIDRLTEFGRLAVPCPMQSGHYYLKNFYVDETKMPMYRMMPEGLVFVLEAVFKQEMSGKMARVFDLEAHYMCNRSNWPK